MRVVALEEHFTLPSLVRQIPREAVTARGFPAPEAPWGPGRVIGKLTDLDDASALTLTEGAANTSLRWQVAAGSGRPLSTRSRRPARLPVERPA